MGQQWKKNGGQNKKNIVCKYKYINNYKNYR